MLGRLGSARVQAAAVGTALAGVLATGGATVALDLTGAAAGDVAVTASADAPADLGDDRPVRPRGEAPAAPVPAPVQGAPVAALTALHVPDLVVRSPTPLDAATIAALYALEGVAGAAVLDSGTVDVGGSPAFLVGADPSELRALTPQETAASDDLWSAVARGELAGSYALVQSRALELGSALAVAGQDGRLGAVAAFGLPQADLVTSRAAARARGAVPDSVVLLAAPQLTTGVLRTAVQRVVPDAEVELLRPAEVAPSTVKGRPSSWRELYVDSARFCPGLSWTVLAAIGQVESGHGRHLGPSSAGALGPMQFLPSTWAAYGIDGDGDGTADIMSPFDAVPSAASYLCRHGATRGEQGLYDAVFAYNHADWYVRKVLGLAAQYAQQG